MIFLMEQYYAFLRLLQKKTADDFSPTAIRKTENANLLIRIYFQLFNCLIDDTLIKQFYNSDSNCYCQTTVEMEKHNIDKNPKQLNTPELVAPFQIYN